MKKTLCTILIMSLFILLTAMQCDADDELINCEDTQMELFNFKSNIQALANTSVCGDAFECRFIALGSKPCGGPWEYLIYTTSIDTLSLTSLVMEYNQLEANYNLNCNAVSDCAVAQPPVGFDCVNNQCIPIF